MAEKRIDQEKTIHELLAEAGDRLIMADYLLSVGTPVADQQAAMWRESAAWRVEIVLTELRGEA